MKTVKTVWTKSHSSQDSQGSQAARKKKTSDLGLIEKYCSRCNKYFILPGACGDYFYRTGPKYYCSYTCWRAMKAASK